MHNFGAHYITASIVLSAASVYLPAQTVEDSIAATRALTSASSPAACVAAVGKVTSASFGGYNAASKRGDGATANRLMDAISTASAENSRRCAYRFPIEKVGAEQIGALIELYGMGDAVDSIARLVDRLDALKLSPAQRLDALWKAFDGTMPSPPGEPTASGVKLGERYAKLLDAMGAMAASRRVTAHSRLVRWTAEGSDVQREHGESAIAAARAVSTDSVKAREDAIGEAYVAASEAEGFAWRFDQAAQKAREGAALVNDTHRRKKELEFMARRYELVGKPAPIIEARYWLNGVADKKQVDFSRAKLTMLGFSSVTCMVCRQGYPVVLRAKDRLAKSGFQPMLIARLEGEPGGTTPPTADQEVAYDKSYWVEHQRIDFPIAIVETPTDKNGEYVSPQVFKDYGLQFYPLYVFVDQAGIVRYVQRGNGPDLGATIEKVLRRVSEGSQRSTKNL